MKRIYVGNLPFSATEDEVRELFAEYGPVNSVHLISDRETGRPRGFGLLACGVPYRALVSLARFFGLRVIKQG